MAGGAISKLAVILTGNAAGFKTELQGAVGSVNALGSSVENVKGVLSSFTGILGTVGLGFSLWAGLSKAGESEQAVVTLGSVVRSTGQAAGFTSDELQKMGGELAGVTTFGRTAVVSAEAVLATFTNIKGDQFKEAMTAAANLSTVLKQDLQTSVVQIGKALNDPEKGFTALKRAGVSFTQSQVEQIKALQDSGDILGAQTVILGELEHEFGGAAEAAGSTFSNQIDKGRESIGEIAAVIASGMLPALASMASWLKQGADWAQQHKEGLRELGQAILVVIGAVAAYKTVVFALAAAQRIWNAVQAISLALEGPAGWIQLAAAGVILAGTYTAIASASQESTSAVGDAGKQAAQARVQMAGLAEDGEEGADGIEKVGHSAKKVGNDVAALTKRLREQVLTFGMSQQQADIYKLKMEGATDAQLKQAGTLAALAEQQDAQKKATEDAGHALEELGRKAASIVEDMKDPFEKLQDQFDEISKMFAKGLLTADQAEQARQAAADKAAKTASGQFKNNQKAPDFGQNFFGQSVAAVERRFTAGFTDPNKDKLEQVRKLNERTAKAAERTAKNTDALARNNAAASTDDTVVDY